MSVLDRLLRRPPQAKATPVGAALYPSGSSNGIPVAGTISFQGWPDRQAGNQRTVTDEQRARAAVTSAWVYSDIRAIANEVSAAELSVKRPSDGTEDADTEIEHHPLEDLWVRPNPYMGRSFVMQYWAWQLETLGEAYLYFAPDSTNLSAVREIWPIPSLFMTPEGDAKTFISRFRFQTRPDQAPILIDPHYICYSRLPNPFDIRRGMSPLVAAYLAIETDKAMSHWNRDFFGKDNATPTSIISLPKETVKAQFDAVKADLLEFFGGGQRRTAVIRAGDMDVQTISSLQKDMEFISGRSFSRDEIDRVYGIPSGYWSGEANRANANHAKGVLIDNAVWPLLVMLAEDINTQIVPQWYGDVTADFEDIRPRDQEMDLKELEAHKSHWTIEELRKHDKKQPLGDWRDTLLLVQVPTGKTTDPADDPPPPPPMVPDVQPVSPSSPDSSPALDSAATPPADPMPAGLVGKSADLEKWERKAIKRLRSGRPAACSFESEYLSDAESTAIETALAEAGSEEAVKAAFRVDLAPVGDGERSDVFLSVRHGDGHDLHHRGLPKAAAVVSLTPTEQALMDRIRAILTQHGKIAAAAVVNGSMPSLDALSSDLRAAIQSAVVQAIIERATELADTIGVDFDDVTIASAAGDWAEKYTYDLVGGLTDSSRTVLQKTLASYQASPMSRDDLIRRLAPVFGDRRAESIAITEISRAANQGTLTYQSYLKDNGLEFERVWETANDDDQCAVCAPLNQQPEDAWVAEFPDGGPAHPRCRCSTSLRLKGGA